MSSSTNTDRAVSQGRLRVATSPTNFGVQRMIPAEAWKPEPLEVLDAVAAIGYDGLAFGPPGYLGTKEELPDRLGSRNLQLAEAFLPFHFSRSDRFDEERAGLKATLDVLSAVSDSADRPLAVLSEGFREPSRWSNAGRASSHPEISLPADRFDLMVSNLHRIAEDCRNAGFEPVLHFHAGTYIETDSEIRNVLDVLDSSLVGLCLDTAHAWLGGADPRRLAEDYYPLVRHVHMKDLSLEAVANSHANGHDLTGLTMSGAFRPLGTGDACLTEFAEILNRNGYGGWIVVEQDRLLFQNDRFEEVVSDERSNFEFLRAVFP